MRVRFGHSRVRPGASALARARLRSCRWLITFMMQVNPLIYPLMPQAEGEELLNVTNATVLEE